MFTELQRKVLIEILSIGKVDTPTLFGKLEKKGVETHINSVRKAVGKLDELKLIKVGKFKVRKRTYYNLSPKRDRETFKKIAQLLLKSSCRLEFIRSKYAQSIIDEDFVDHFAVGWCREYFRFLQTKYGSKMYGKDADEIEDDRLRSGFYANLGEAFIKKAFTEEEIEKSPAKERLVENFRTSPTSLYNFLFPEELFEEGEIRVLNIGDYFLWPFISDMAYALPQGKGMEVKLQLSFGNLKKEDISLKEMAERLGKRDLITPTFKVKTESKIYNPLFTALSQKERREKHEKKVKKRR